MKNNTVKEKQDNKDNKFVPYYQKVTFVAYGIGVTEELYENNYDRNTKQWKGNRNAEYFNYPWGALNGSFGAGEKSYKENLLDLSKNPHMKYQKLFDEDFMSMAVVDNDTIKYKSFDFKAAKQDLFKFIKFKINPSAKVLSIDTVKWYFRYATALQEQRSLEWNELSKKFDVVIIDTQSIKQDAEKNMISEIALNLDDTFYFNATNVFVFNLSAIEVTDASSIRARLKQELNK